MSGLTEPGAAQDERAVERLAAEMSGLDLPGRLKLIARATSGRVVFTTSFGLEDQAIVHAIWDFGVPVDVVTLDTGRLFPETYDLWAETEERYGRRIRALAPATDALEGLIAEQGVNGFRRSVPARVACCAIRKMEPLDRALAGAAVWITGLRSEQSQHRAQTPFVVHDPARGLLKANPLADWSRAVLADYIQSQRVPYNILHDRGFPSVGCAPCTRAVRVGEPERAGRWWWEEESKKECGLHLRMPSRAAAQPAAA